MPFGGAFKYMNSRRFLFLSQTELFDSGEIYIIRMEKIIHIKNKYCIITIYNRLLRSLLMTLKSYIHSRRSKISRGLIAIMDDVIRFDKSTSSIRKADMKV